MDGIVAKRTLKRSYYEGANKPCTYTNNKEVQNKKKIKSGLKERIFFKMALQTITVTAILIFIFAVKFLNIQVVKESIVVKKLKKEWDNNYTFDEIKKVSIKSLNNVYGLLKPIVPQEIKKVVNAGLFKLAQKNENNQEINEVVNVDNKEVHIYEEINSSESENKEEIVVQENVGTSVEEKNEAITAASSLSYEDEIAEKIKETGIKFVKPVKGNITSNFGAREVIFEGVESYHTGTDIGAKSGTEVVSSIIGTVTVATYNQYNGNYIEVTNGDVVTKYLHLSKITVKKGKSVKAGEKIGEVGSTGLSTGPHLHFEVLYKNSKIDPRLVVDL